MKTLHLYLTRQVLATLAMTVAVFTFVLLLGNVLREILALLVNGQTTIGLVLQAVALLIPFVLVFALPMGMLTATLLVFGRFSADQELTAVRASGVSLVALITPVLLLSAGLSCVSALVNLQVAPQCRVAYKNLFYRIGLERSTSLIMEGRFMDDFPGYIVYVGKKSGTNLYEVRIDGVDADGKMTNHIVAARATLVSDVGNNRAYLRLYNVYETDLVNWSGVNSFEEISKTLTTKPLTQPAFSVSLSDMTFRQLWRKLSELEQLGVRAAPIPRATVEQMREQKRQLEAIKADLTMPVRVQIHRQVAFSFACIGFTLVGIPLGIRAHRRETSVGVAMALILVLTYYSFIIVGQSLESRPELAPHLIVWLPNFIFQAVGAVLLWRANRGV
ncbi:MAG TPA: LptF/LptG family permease [Candidatus Angelobacter sp.]|nr:LptF/LptG family permease [Candidatus Angelobacter sp.]